MRVRVCVLYGAYYARLFRVLPNIVVGAGAKGFIRGRSQSASQSVVLLCIVHRFKIYSGIRSTVVLSTS